MWHLNCTALNQPESSNFFMYIIFIMQKISEIWHSPLWNYCFKYTCTRILILTCTLSQNFIQKSGWDNTVYGWLNQMKAFWNFFFKLFCLMFSILRNEIWGFKYSLGWQLLLLKLHLCLFLLSFNVVAIQQVFILLKQPI